MKTIKKIIAVLVLCAAIPAAYPSQFTATEQGCSQMDAERDGIKCAVRYIDGLGDTLMIRVHGKAGDPQEKRDRTKQAISTTIHNFLASGGIWIKMRTTRMDGQLVERQCSKIKHGKREQCGEWYPVEDD